MKIKLSLLCFLLVGVLTQSEAVPATTDFEDHVNSEAIEMESVVSHPLTKSALRSQRKAAMKQARLEKRLTWLNKIVTKRLKKRAEKGKAPIDFSDPVEKWKWFAIIFGGGGILLMIIGAAAVGSFTLSGAGIGAILWLIGWLAFLFGLASLVIWLIKINE